MAWIARDRVEIVQAGKVVNVTLTVTRVDVKREPRFVITRPGRGCQWKWRVSSRYELTHKPRVVYVRLARCRPDRRDSYREPPSAPCCEGGVYELRRVTGDGRVDANGPS